MLICIASGSPSWSCLFSANFSNCSIVMERISISSCNPWRSCNKPTNSPDAFWTMSCNSFFSTLRADRDSEDNSSLDLLRQLTAASGHLFKGGLYGEALETLISTSCSISSTFSSLFTISWGTARQEGSRRAPIILETNQSSWPCPRSRQLWVFWWRLLLPLLCC